MLMPPLPRAAEAGVLHAIAQQSSGAAEGVGEADEGVQVAEDRVFCLKDYEANCLKSKAFPLYSHHRPFFSQTPMWLSDADGGHPWYI